MDIQDSKKVGRFDNSCVIPELTRLVIIVWPVIAVNLEFKPRTGDGAGGDGKEVGIGGAEV